MWEVIRWNFPNRNAWVSKLTSTVYWNSDLVGGVIDFSDINKKRLEEEFIRFFRSEIVINRINILEGSISINIDWNLCFFWNFLNSKWILICDMILLKEKILSVLWSQTKIEDISNIYREWNDFTVLIRNNLWWAFKVSL